MAKVVYGGQSYNCGFSSVLECLTAQGIAIPSSCHSGVCQACMMWVIDGKVPGGLVSGWIFENLKAGDTVTISEALGDCFYVPGNPGQSILLIGTGSGLAPLFGIIRDALLSGHSGQIKLYHGSYNTAGLYLVSELKGLAQSHANLSYIPCVSEGNAPDGYAQGMVLDVALRDNTNLSSWRDFLCGNPDMVNAAKHEAYLSGAAINNTDPF